MSLDQLRSRRAMQLLIFLSCLSPWLVKKLQKFINSCLKVGHSANLKQSKSTCKWIALGTMHAQHFLISEREWYRFDIGRLRAEPTNYEFAYTRVTRLISQCHNNKLKKERLDRCDFKNSHLMFDHGILYQSLELTRAAFQEPSEGNKEKLCICNYVLRFISGKGIVCTHKFSEWYVAHVFLKWNI